MALAASLQETMILRQVLPTFGCPFTGPTPTYEENMSCIVLATNDMTPSKTKHINIKHHFIRGLIKKGAISIVWCPTSNMLADILPKFSLPSSIHLKHARRMLSGTYYGPSPVLVSWGSVGAPSYPCHMFVPFDYPHHAPP